MITPTRPIQPMTPQAPMRVNRQINRDINPNVIRRLNFNELQRQETLPLPPINEETFPTIMPLTREITMYLNWAPRPFDEAVDVDTGINEYDEYGMLRLRRMNAMGLPPVGEQFPPIPPLRRTDASALNYEIRRIQQEIPLQLTSDDEDDDVIEIMNSSGEIDMSGYETEKIEEINEWEFGISEDEFDAFDEE